MFGFFSENSKELLQGLTLNMAGGAAAALAILFITHELTSKMKFEKAYSKIKEEMAFNKEKLNEFETHFKQYKTNLMDISIEETWLPKEAVITPWSRFVYHYLKLDAFLYFINQEFMAEDRISKEKKSHLLVFYAECIRFNNETQMIEEELNDERKSAIESGREIKDLVDKNCKMINDLFIKYHKGIFKNYDQFFSE